MICPTCSSQKGGVQRIKKHYDLRFLLVHGESISADVGAIAKHMPRIRAVMVSFGLCGTWIAHELGLFYRQQPGWTLSGGGVQGHKKDKIRLTFLACCNSDRTEKWALMIVNSAANHRDFKKKSGREFGFDYHAQKKAWMTMTLFFAWLQRVDEHVG